MNFKIENNFLDITNYPSIERHLEEMASNGWLIKRIISGNIFIYKRIRPEILDFSITPYEIETAFTKKSKGELEEFNGVCKSVGWNYATKSYDLHIYFKEHGSEAMDIQTDDEEEFKTLELIGKKYIKSYYILISLLLFISWATLGRLYSSVYAMKDGITQIAAPLILVGIILIIINLINIKKFLKTNKKNMELGKSIEYSDSKFYSNRIFFALVYIILFIFIIYVLYVVILLKNKFILIGLIPVLIGGIVGVLYRIFIKPAKITIKNKKIGFVATLAISIIFSMLVFGSSIMNIINGDNHNNNQTTDGHNVLFINDFIDKTLEEDGDLIEQASILIPKSYEYYSYSRGYGSIRTEYSKALTEKLANNLVNRYKRQAKNALTGRYSREIELYFKEGVFGDYLLTGGLTREDLHNLEGKEIKEAMRAANNIINERSIAEDKENLWKLEEVYFLNYEKTEIVIRNGKEVFYLEGLDFSDDEIIKIVKDELNLN